MGKGGHVEELRSYGIGDESRPLVLYIVVEGVFQQVVVGYGTGGVGAVILAQQGNDMALCGLLLSRPSYNLLTRTVPRTKIFYPPLEFVFSWSYEPMCGRQAESTFFLK